MVEFVTEHFTWNEVISSQKATELSIDNSLPSDITLHESIKNTAIHMEVVRNVLHSVGVHIDSWYRCLALNRVVGSKDTSQHLLGEAVDFVAQGFGTPLDICRELIKYRGTIEFDQLILEHTWVHISFCSPADTPRNKVLSLLQDGTYAQGLTDKYGAKLT